MKVVALVSGGKDSCYNMMQCAALGHEIVALANLKPPRDSEKGRYCRRCDAWIASPAPSALCHCGAAFGGIRRACLLKKASKRVSPGSVSSFQTSSLPDELDSFMFQTIGHDAIQCYAECMNLPLYRRGITGSALNTDADYRLTLRDETEDLLELLQETHHPDVQGVSVGAILSNYQRISLGISVVVEIDAVSPQLTCLSDRCRRLRLTPLAFLWRREQAALLQEMIDGGVVAIVVKVATLGLSENHLGKTLGEMMPHLTQMNQNYGVHMCGEGGEYETLCLDCPLFIKRIVVEDCETVILTKDAFAPVAYLKLRKIRVEEKSGRRTVDDWKHKINSRLTRDEIVLRCVDEARFYENILWH
ncbi:MAG: hypothetical protein BJ554DRAFT_898 [Olpidium bornovanus]|uniref:Diphthine--ammonia ligase n=1 Tax=Olpidium bornovanus TaxID=278681 RepID=A0A8H8A1C9_9FUNG|nr:MAG: hypothetical protein BJ554DRAFT_898 [Olpidium bornovanus]